ncbi:hypothetical protein [Dickeya dadantii]|uniref:hypothetical protein n=1 Tax=Dickeya dadantii TaxID=204038 RepID=UPI0025428481|nr:hypothetical protein [Dickeya dadantii]
MLSTDAAQPAASAIISARFSVPLCLRGVPDKTPKTLDFINYNLSLLIIYITTFGPQPAAAVLPTRRLQRFPEKSCSFYVTDSAIKATMLTTLKSGHHVIVIGRRFTTRYPCRHFYLTRYQRPSGNYY